MSVKKKFFWISAIVLIAAIVIVICISLLTNGQVSEFDGTLVWMNFDFPSLL
jgi:hypothetical protein